MRASRRRGPGAIFLAVLIVASCSRFFRLSAAAAAEGTGGGGGKGAAAADSSAPPSRLAAAAADLFSSLASLLGEAKPLGPEELDQLRASLDVRTVCETDRFLPAKRMPATLALPRLVARITGRSCRVRGGNSSTSTSTSSLLGGLVSCSPGKASWFYQEPLLLPERTTPAALFAGSCALSLFPASLKIDEAEAVEAAAKTTTKTTVAEATNNGEGSTTIDAAAFSAAPLLASSNFKRIQVLRPLVVRCESLEALKRGECSVVEREESGQRKGKEKGGKESQKKRSRRVKDAAAAAGPVLPSAGAVAAEVGREVYEALRAF